MSAAFFGLVVLDISFAAHHDSHPAALRMPEMPFRR
jgi:hypothetical protein